MKKLLTLTAVYATFIAPALAVQKCVQLSASSQCEGDMGEENSTTWALDCEQDVYIKGVAVCTSTSGTTQSMLYHPYDTNSAIHCWCKTYSPFESVWVHAYQEANVADCMSYCSSYCLYNADRSKLFTPAN